MSSFFSKIDKEIFKKSTKIINRWGLLIGFFLFGVILIRFFLFGVFLFWFFLFWGLFVTFWFDSFWLGMDDVFPSLCPRIPFPLGYEWGFSFSMPMHSHLLGYSRWFSCSVPTQCVNALTICSSRKHHRQFLLSDYQIQFFRLDFFRLDL